MSSAIWITGLPASGKSVLARAVAAALAAVGEPAVVLELDEIRKFVTPSPTYTDSERDVVYRALVYMAAALTTAGRPVIIDATAHRRVWRQLARQLIPRFAEVQLVCPLEVCRERERRRTTGHAPRGIYARAGSAGSMVPGIDVPYEPALRPELTIETRVESPDIAAQRIVALFRRLGPPTQGPRVDRRAGWAIWVTGLPGSGKTTLSRTGAESLAARSMPVRVLEFADIRRVLLDEGPESDATREIVHRALAYTAWLLTTAGVSVIVDATAPRRVWRQLARERITHFAEVQLVCPDAVCDERERAARWHLGSQPPVAPAGSAAATPDIALAYERSLRPELTLHTDGDFCGNLEALLRLALALQHEARSGGYEPRESLVS